MGKSSGDEFDTFLANIGQKLKTLRVESGFSSYEHFAYEKNFGRAQYGKYERGTEDMRLSSLFKILQALDISWEDFFKDIDQK